ncbi:FkbM family methyltransferase [uncultured Gammaproteobacteria bacterium]
MTETLLPWLQRLFDHQSVNGLRNALAVMHPAFNQLPARIAIVGTAGEGLRLARLCRTHGIEIAAIADDNPDRQGEVVEGLKVVAVPALEALDKATPIVIASHRVLKATDRLKGLGFVHVAPFALLQVLNGRIFPPHMFYDGWLEDLLAHRDRYVALAKRLADDDSRRVLNAVLAFRQTLDPQHLAPVVQWELYKPGDLIRFESDEVYVDAGTFDGDTIHLFIERTGGRFERILGFEPDPVTFQRLAANFAGEPRVEPVNAGLYDRKTVLHFHNDASRGSVLGEEGAIEVAVVALDDILDGQRASFIKMNIEGAELKALEGARRTLTTCYPKLAISAYHRPADLWEVAATLDGIRNDYNLFLRQHDGGVIETVLYALPVTC